MAASGFTDTWLKNLKPGTKRRDFTDKNGFMLRVWPGGEKTFVYRYHVKSGKKSRQRIMTLGTYPAMTLIAASKAHLAAREQFKNGLDPIEEKARVKAAQEAQELRRRETNAITVRNVIAEWGWHHARKKRKRPREAIRLLTRYIGGPWKGRPANELRRRDGVLLLDRIVAGGAPVMANRIRDLGNQVFTFSVARDLIAVNPFTGIPRPGGDEESSDRWLTADEVRAFWSALEASTTAMSAQVRLGLKLILVTAQRPGEVANARFDQFDMEARLWTIPAAIAKNGREHLVPLSDLAGELVAELRGLADGRPHLLPSQQSKKKRDEPISGRALSRALHNNVTKGKAPKLFGLEPFTPHDLRRTAATHLTQLGIPRLHVLKLLNHSDRETTAIYDRNAYSDEKRQALQVWADELRIIVAGKERKVVPIRGRP